MTAWVVRTGVAGERDHWALANGFDGGGFDEIGSMATMTSRAEIQSAVEVAFSGEHPGKISNYVGQLNALRFRIVPGDVIVLPLKSSANKKVAIGVCTEGYLYASDEPDPTRRHLIKVEWARTDIPRTAFKDDLLYTLNGAMSYFRAERHQAEARLRTVIATGVDPGQNGRPSTPGVALTTATDDIADVTDPTVVPTVQAIRDRVQNHVIENFKGHKLTYLVADILRAKGFTCDVSPEGPDGGVDILVGSGPLGLDEPKLVVEVKSEESQVTALVVRGLQGAISTQGASQGLLIAWGGLNGPAQSEIKRDRLKIRVWEADQVLDQLFDVYEHLPEATQRLIPLKRVWALDEDETNG
jgi:restriction system protein